MESILELNHVSFEANGNEILKDITFTVNKGEIITFTGPSGSGKSTLLKLIGYLLNPTSGTIQYKNKDITQYEPTEYRKEVSYFFQNAVLFDEVVRDNLAFPAKIRDESFDEERAIEGLEAVQLSKAYLDQPIHELSGGERQRVALIRNLMYPPEILLMDEVTSSLDKENREIVSSFITRLNEKEEVTVLWITHNEDEINASNRIIHLEEGKMEDV
ncbi:MAG TPA: ATP-binding cassette domain-containing protein, partial [Atopostipes sp.]|nr:ATP-binding cassette domain-containing protein [Atopostipes sp.]